MSSDRPAAGDAALLAAAQAGDLDAFAALYERYQHVVYRFALGMTGAADAAEDATHDTFLRLLADAGRYDSARASAPTFLYGIVRNVCRERLRRLSRLRPLDGLDLPGGLAAPTVADALDEAEQAARVRRALARMPSRYREVVILCDLHDLSYEEAAAVVRATVPAVRSRLHRGRQWLRSALTEVTSSPTESLRPIRCLS